MTVTPSRSRRLRRRLGVAAALAGFMLAAGVPFGLSTSEAATIADAGWWDRYGGVPVGGPPPPEGGLRVANDPTGESAVAAVRIGLDAGETRPALVLRVTGSPVPEGAGFLACRPEKGWAGADGGDWAERPTPDCDAGRAGGRIAADGTTVTFDLASLTVGQVADVVISPAPAGQDAVAATFSTDFAAPVPGDVRTQAGGTTTTTSVFSPSPTTSPSPSPSPGGDSTGGASFTPPAAAPAAPVIDDEQPPATTPDPPPTSPAIDTSDDDEVAAVSGGADDDDRTGKRVASAGLALGILGIGAYLWNTDRTRVAMAGPLVGGLGPFRRERDGPAPEVS